MALDRDRVEKCLAAVDAYKASGQKATAWAQDHGVKARDLASWCAHAEGWRAWLAGEVSPRSRQGRGLAAAAGPVQAAKFAAVPHMAAPPLRGSVWPEARVEITWPLQARSVSLSWPLAHARELAQWLKELEP